MKFGHLEIDQLDKLSLSLPKDNSGTTMLLPGKPNIDARLLAGCGKWGIKEWVGSLYPEGTKEKDYLTAYKDIYTTIELNNTFYRLSRSAIISWAENVSDTPFLFCPKWSRRVSHIKRLKTVEENTQYFIDSCYLFGKSLGATLLQMPENFGVKNFDRIEPFLKLLPKDFPVQIEFRHKEWFENPMLDELCDLLEKYKVGLAITDTAGRRDVIHQRLTTEDVFIRFNGYSLHKSDFDRMDEWIDRIDLWFKEGLRNCYFFCHQQDETNTPETSRYFIEKANEKLNMSLTIPPSL